MHRPSTHTGKTLPAALLLAAVAAIIVVAGGAVGRGADPTPTPAPSVAPSASPSVQPSAPSTPSPTAGPTEEPSDGPITVDLENPTDHDVSVAIDDETGTLRSAASGSPGDGMSVRWFDATVENLDAETLRVVWVGLPRDEELILAIFGEGGKYRLRLVQSAPPANSDALGFDRVLELRFDSPVSAADVDVSIEEIDTDS